MADYCNISFIIVACKNYWNMTNPNIEYNMATHYILFVLEVHYISYIRATYNI